MKKYDFVFYLWGYDNPAVHLFRDCVFIKGKEPIVDRVGYVRDDLAFFSESGKALIGRVCKRCELRTGIDAEPIDRILARLFTFLGEHPVLLEHISHQFQLRQPDENCIDILCVGCQKILFAGIIGGEVEIISQDDIKVKEDT